MSGRRETEPRPFTTSYQIYSQLDVAINHLWRVTEVWKQQTQPSPAVFSLYVCSPSSSSAFPFWKRPPRATTGSHAGFVYWVVNSSDESKPPPSLLRLTWLIITVTLAFLLSASLLVHLVQWCRGSVNAHFKERQDYSYVPLSNINGAGGNTGKPQNKDFGLDDYDSQDEIWSLPPSGRSKLWGAPRMRCGNCYCKEKQLKLFLHSM